MAIAAALRNISSRIQLGKFLNDISIKNTACFNFGIDGHEKFLALLYSEQQEALLSVISSVEKNRCSPGLPCHELDQLIQLFLSEESSLTSEIIAILEGSDTKILHDFSKPHAGYLYISLLFNIFLAILLTKSYWSTNFIKRWKSDRRRNFTGGISFITIFLISYSFSYYKHFKEALANRLSHSVKGNPCEAQGYNLYSWILSFIQIDYSYSDCQQYIETTENPFQSHIGWTIFDVNPLDPLIDVVSKILFGWIAPLGFYLNGFYRKLAYGIPFILQISLLSTICLCSSLMLFVIRRGSEQQKPKKESPSPFRIHPSRKISRDPSISRKTSNSRTRRSKRKSIMERL